MFDYLLSDEAIKLRVEVRDFVRWVPREMVLDINSHSLSIVAAKT